MMTKLIEYTDLVNPLIYTVSTDLNSSQSTLARNNLCICRVLYMGGMYPQKSFEMCDSRSVLFHLLHQNLDLSFVLDGRRGRNCGSSDAPNFDTGLSLDGNWHKTYVAIVKGIVI